MSCCSLRNLASLSASTCTSGLQKNGLSWSDYEGLNQIKREQLSPRSPVNKKAHAVHLDTASFTETGGLSALAGTGHKEDVGYSTLGARLATYYLLQNGMARAQSQRRMRRAVAPWQRVWSTQVLGFVIIPIR